VIARLLITWGVIAAAIALAVFVHRRFHGEDDLPDYRVVLGFVGPAYGVLLGLLVVFAVGHYSDAGDQAEDEATSLVAIYDQVGVYPAETRDSARHDLVCYMRSIVDDDWPSMGDGETTEAPRTLVFGDRIRSDMRDLPLDSDREGSAYGPAVGFITDASKARQQLLFLTQPQIPVPLWVVIYVGIFVLVFLIALHYTDEPRGRVTALACVTLLLTVVVSVLGMLDNPFGPPTRVQPDEMRQAIALLSEDANSTVLGPCSPTAQPR
jgi:hypothetical protein